MLHYGLELKKLPGGQKAHRPGLKPDQTRRDPGNGKDEALVDSSGPDEGTIRQPYTHKTVAYDGIRVLLRATCMCTESPFDRVYQQTDSASIKTIVDALF